MWRRYIPLLALGILASLLTLIVNGLFPIQLGGLPLHPSAVAIASLLFYIRTDATVALIFGTITSAAADTLFATQYGLYTFAFVVLYLIYTFIRTYSIRHESALPHWLASVAALFVYQIIFVTAEIIFFEQQIQSFYFISAALNWIIDGLAVALLIICTAQLSTRKQHLFYEQ